MLTFVSSTKGIIIMSVLAIFVLIPIVYFIKALLKPEHIEVENGQIKFKEGALFYNLALQNPIYTKIAIFCLILTTLISILMYYCGIDAEVFDLVFHILIYVCIVLLLIQVVEERKTFLFGFLPIILQVIEAFKVLLGLILGIFYLLKMAFVGIANILFIFPFKILYKILGIK